MVGQSRWTRYAAYAVLSLASAVILLPLLWVLRTSFADKVVAYKIPPDLFFAPTLDNYREILLRFNFASFFANSLLIASATTVIALGIGASAAYVIERYRAGGAAAPIAILATQMMPPIVLVIPFFL